jgi:hypothetical protein
MPHASDIQIYGSVGRNGVNRNDDVSKIQQLINEHLPIPLRPLDVDGQCGPLTIGAIEEIQRRYLGMNRPDGKIDPHGATLRKLTGASPPPKPHPGHGTFPPDVIAAAQASHTAWQIPASITLAQWALESNWGRAMPAGSNNPFGIKAAAGQPFVQATTREVINGQSVTVVAKFRRFVTISEAFDHHGKLLATGRPYARARTLANDPDAFANALTGVYATDPNYGASLKRLMKSYNLYQYD